ncbi:MAG: LolA-like outer membrane lipoprotein chaperone [Arcobacteraceae bacterium]
MKYFKTIIVYVLLLSTFVFANDFRDLKTFEASFTQKITNPSGNEVAYNGLIFIKEPNKIKWQYNDPIKKFVYIKKYTVTIIEPELEQIIVTNLDKEINIINLLKNAQEISINEYKSNFNNIEYSLTLKNGQLQKISYQDEIENDVVISFFDVKQNEKIDDEVFKFIIPDYYDVIRK